MVQVLTHLLRGGHHVFLCDPVLQLLHLSAQQEVMVGVVQFIPAVLCQLPQTCVLLIYLALTPDDLLTGKIHTQKKFSKVLFVMPTILITSNYK